MLVFHLYACVADPMSLKVGCESCSDYKRQQDARLWVESTEVRTTNDGLLRQISNVDAVAGSSVIIELQLKPNK